MDLALLLAVLCVPALALAGEDEKVDPKLEKQIRASIEKGRAYIEKRQGRDGCWRYDGDAGLGFGAGRGREIPDATAGLTALALYALSSTGTHAGHPVIKRGLMWIAKNPRGYSTDGRFGTYSASFLVLALTRISPEAHRKQIQELAGRIAAAQLENGMWHYRLGKVAAGAVQGVPGGAAGLAGDNSNTQCAVLALWAAQEHAGFKVPKPVWPRVRDHFAKSQLRDGAWGYRPGSGGRGGGTATRAKPAMNAMALVSYIHGYAGAKGGRKKLAEARKSKVAVKGLERFKRWPRSPSEDFYQLWSIERVGTVFAQPLKDWYVEGAGALVKSQLRPGHWGGPVEANPPGMRPPQVARVTHGDSRSIYETAFALLFLSRATGKVITSR